ncbi:MAG TPA: cupin domain-containing protein [Micromonosporaceae bacterium]|nr:cupin domain-containing protein [Micromonosporaceae bacterium]
MTETQVSFPLDQVTVVDNSEIRDRPWEPLRGLVGVEHKLLWNSGQMNVGLIRVAPGAEEPGHVHHNADHHVQVLSGSANIAGQHVGPGDFVYVPAGVRHATTDVGPDGCTFFYTYVPRH